MKKHIIFDFDDTISSSYELNQQLFVDTFARFGNQVDEDYLRRLHLESKGVPMLDYFVVAVQKFSLQVDPHKLVEENEQLHLQNVGEMTLFENMESILMHFKTRGKTLSICSNRDIKSLMQILDKHKLGKYFDNLISCKEAGHEKPDPYCLKELLNKYPDISAGETIYFGDSKTDSEFAQNAGVDYVVIDHYLNKKLFYHLILETFADSEDAEPLERS